MTEPTPQPDRDLDALFALARARRPDTSRAEYGFETRLMARLHARPHASSVWAMVSWRVIPFLAVCVLGLTVWQTEMASDANDAMSLASLNDPAGTEEWAN